MSNNNNSNNGQTPTARENLHQEPQEQESYTQIRVEAVDQIIKHGLSRAESKLFFYLLTLDSDGSEMKNIPSPQEMAEAIGTSAKQVKRSLAKLEELGLYKTEVSSIRRGRHLSRLSSSTTIKGEA